MSCTYKSITENIANLYSMSYGKYFSSKFLNIIRRLGGNIVVNFKFSL